MKRILLPIDETTRSLFALTQVKKLYPSKDYEIILMMVDERLDYTASREASLPAIDNLTQKLELVAGALEDYKVIIKPEVGRAGNRIVKVAREFEADIIVMTKSSKEDMNNKLGRTTEYVINNAPCNVMIANENLGGHRDKEYRGLVYRKAASLVNLRGQFSLKQSECIIPSVSSDCIYHFEVRRGKIRVVHRSYNPETRDWDLPPAAGQEEAVDIIGGESADLFIKAHSCDGKADRIRIVNRNMRTEAVFSYRISSKDRDLVDDEVDN